MEFIKQLLKSKTIIVNVLTVAVGTLGYLAGNEIIAQHPQIVAAIVAGVGAINVVLRLLTAIPVFEKKSLLD